MTPLSADREKEILDQHGTCAEGCHACVLKKAVTALRGELDDIKQCPNESWECAKYQRKIEQERDTLRGELNHLTYQYDRRGRDRDNAERERDTLRECLAVAVEALKDQCCGVGQCDCSACVALAAISKLKGGG